MAQDRDGDNTFLYLVGMARAIIAGIVILAGNSHTAHIIGGGGQNGNGNGGGTVIVPVTTTTTTIRSEVRLAFARPAICRIFPIYAAF